MNAALTECPCRKVHSAPASCRRAVPLLCGAILLSAVLANSAAADGPHKRVYREQHLRGTWVLSGMLRFGAPIPVPGTVVDGAPPHGMVNPGDVVGVWASTVGLITFDGRGQVSHAEQVVKVGEIALPPGLPFESLPPFPELYAGNYTVSEQGVVQIQLSGRSGDSAEGERDFEYDLHCVLNLWPREMKCVPARFKTYAVDMAGYAAPITGVIEMALQR